MMRVRPWEGRPCWVERIAVDEVRDYRVPDRACCWWPLPPAHKLPAPKGATPAPAQPAPAQPAPAQPAAPAARPAPRPFPADAKVAYVDLNTVATTSKEGQAAGVKIKDLQAKRTAELEGKQKQLQAAQQKLEQGGAVLSESARAQQAKEVERLQTELQRSSQDAQKEIQEFTQELQVQFQQKLLPIIEQVAKAKNLHFILSIADAGVVWVDCRPQRDRRRRHRARRRHPGSQVAQARCSRPRRRAGAGLPFPAAGRTLRVHPSPSSRRPALFAFPAADGRCRHRLHVR